MPKKAKELSAVEVARLRPPGGFVGGVPGLFLNISQSGARSWLLKFSLRGRRPEMGLGGFPEVTLAEARTAARASREQIRLGINPIDAARDRRSAEAAKQAASKTFEQCAVAFIKGQEAGWRSAIHARQWTSSLRRLVYPLIGDLQVQDITPILVHKILEKIWLTKHETATRVRSRIENVLDYAVARGYREGPNPARLKGNLDAMLAPSKKVAKVIHHSALPADEIPQFMARLRATQGQGARALEFVILTAARPGEVRGMTWQEIDVERQTWTVPGERMKAGKEHRVALSEGALRLLAVMKRGKGEDLVFPGTKGRLSDMTLTAVLRRLKVPVTAHGFRATFRTWAGEKTNIPREVIEMALAHALPSSVEAAYMRGDLLMKRRELMRLWSEYCRP